MRYKLTISYDGTNYCGWQVQKNGQAIQPLVQNALQVALRHPLDLTGSSRTDAGVHAIGQTAHFDTEQNVNLGKLQISLNALLPPTIRIVAITLEPNDFHARYSATSKIYHYHLHLDPIGDPFTKLYRYQVFGKCDLEKIKTAIPYFLGEHDFTSFANVKEVRQTDAVRNLSRIDIVPQKGGVRLEFQGDGFLYKMVRNIMGTLLDIGSKKIEPDQLPDIFAMRDRRKAGSSAPAHGLFLMQIIYNETSFKDSK